MRSSDFTGLGLDYLAPFIVTEMAWGVVLSRTRRFSISGHLKGGEIAIFRIDRSNSDDDSVDAFRVIW